MSTFSDEVVVLIGLAIIVIGMTIYHCLDAYYTAQVTIEKERTKQAELNFKGRSHE